MPAKSYGIALICSYLPAKQVVTDRLKKKNYEKLVFRKKKSFALEPTTRKHKKIFTRDKNADDTSHHKRN